MSWPTEASPIHRAGRHVDGYSAGDVVVGAEPIEHAVEAPTAVDKVVAAAALEHLHPGEIVASMERIVELGAADALHAGEGVGADGGIAGRGPRRTLPRNPRCEIDGHARGRVEIRQQCTPPLPVMMSLPAIPSNSLNVAGRLPIEARPGVAGGDIDIVKGGGADLLDRNQRVGANRSIAVTVPAAMSTVIGPVASA